MPQPQAERDLVSGASGKVVRRLIPFLMLCYFVAYLDRVNVGFAALTMNADLGFTAEMFGFGAGIFFAGYFLFEVPSNLLLERFGARLWIARIMVTWGVLATGMAFVSGPLSFYTMRFLLGAAEAGFFPGVILYLTYWFGAAERARWIGLFMTAIPLCSVIGGPISGWILDHLDGRYGFAGWQWLFVIEGLPSIAVGLACLVFLYDGPAYAYWLDPDERAALIQRYVTERDDRDRHRLTLRQVFTHPHVLALGLIDFGIVSGNYGLGYWLPTIVGDAARAARLDEVLGVGLHTATGALVAIPYGLAAITMVFWTRRSDRRGERIWHVAAPSIAGGCALAAAALMSNPWLALFAMSICAICTYAALPTFWTLPTAFLSGGAAAGGIAFINSLGNIGGFVGPYLLGRLRDADGSPAPGLVALAGCYVVAGMATLVLSRPPRASARSGGGASRSPRN